MAGVETTGETLSLLEAEKDHGTTIINNLFVPFLDPDGNDVVDKDAFLGEMRHLGVDMNDFKGYEHVNMPQNAGYQIFIDNGKNTEATVATVFLSARGEKGINLPGSFHKLKDPIKNALSGLLVVRIQEKKGSLPIHYHIDRSEINVISPNDLKNQPHAYDYERGEMIDVHDIYSGTRIRFSDKKGIDDKNLNDKSKSELFTEFNEHSQKIQAIIKKLTSGNSNESELEFNKQKSLKDLHRNQQAALSESRDLFGKIQVEV